MWEGPVCCGRYGLCVGGSVRKQAETAKRNKLINSVPPGSLLQFLPLSRLSTVMECDLIIVR